MAVSVVVASRQPAAELARALRALEPQVQRLGGRIVVARDPAAGPLEGLAPSASVDLVLGPPGASIPVLRGLGLRAAAGELVALTEDHLYPAPDWLETLLAPLEAGFDVVGGGMENRARGRLVDWAAYFSDYGFYSFARGPGRTPSLLTDANVVYPRRWVADIAAWASSGAWENVVHDRLARRGARFRFEPAARMYHEHRYGLAAFLGNRFTHGRDYARARRVEQPDTAGWARALGAPVLVPLLWARIARASWREAPGAFVGAAPLTFLLLAGWAAGEAVGYLGPRTLAAAGPAPLTPAGRP